MIDEIGARYGLTDAQGSTLLNEKTRIYEQEEQGIKIVPGAIEFARRAAQHYRLALATSATPRNRMTTLNRLGIANFFEVAADLGDVSEPKPSAEIYLTVYFASCASAVPMPSGGRLSDGSPFCQACRMLRFGPDSNLRGP
jgi:beta-phosphoglucomutase-like phosphatase (HAD superfamily)